MTSPDELKRLYADLTAVTQLGALAQRIGHDLRGPLTALAGTIEIEAARAADPEQKKIFLELQAETDRMTAILHSLTRFGRPAGPSCERIRVGDLLAEVAAVAALLPGADAVKFSLPEPGGPETAGSRADLRQAFFNLARNAVEAVAGNAGDRRVSLSVSGSSGRIRVCVSDNGPGMSTELLRDAFKKALPARPGGSGLGLLIARDLLLRTKGEVRLLPALGGGMVVEVLLLPA